MTFEQYMRSYLNDPAARLFSSATIQRFSNEGENEFDNERNCIVKRISLDIATGITDYQVPDEVQNIRRITWRGFKLDPMTHRNQREFFQNATQMGRPYWYVFDNVGLLKIRFFPAPNETLAALTGDLYSSSNIRNGVIMEYSQTPDFTTAVIPAYIRRRLLKYSVYYNCYAIEGAGQNIKASVYFKSRWENLKSLYAQGLDELNLSPRKLIQNGMATNQFFPGRPVFPIDRFGESVDIGQ